MTGSASANVERGDGGDTRMRERVDNVIVSLVDLTGGR